RFIVRALHHEGMLIGGMLACMLVFPWISRRIDVTSAPVDPGILSVVIVAVLTFLVFKAVTWMAIRVIWPVFAEYSEVCFEDNFLSLTVPQKVLIYLGFYMMLLWSMVSILRALVG
ncbi:hypothetical protein, partial [Pararcticibacter amylolyticus]|uniref:hypothetical protein n=1 Tax=Pararcticibacter amylolyticus TaxID=2173175 RepID=UPI00130492C3